MSNSAVISIRNVRTISGHNVHHQGPVLVALCDVRGDGAFDCADEPVAERLALLLTGWGLEAPVPDVLAAASPDEVVVRLAAALGREAGACGGFAAALRGEAAGERLLVLGAEHRDLVDRADIGVQRADRGQRIERGDRQAVGDEGVGSGNLGHGVILAVVMGEC